MPAPQTAPLPLPSHEEIRRQLQGILASPPFANAARARRFLTYVVEQTLAGQTEGIKELVLGIEVFDRAADFDPKIDTIVRVEAGKLRKRLDEYYAGEGAAATLRIEVPKGSYVPVFHVREQAAAVVVTGSASHRRRYAVGALGLVALTAAVWWGVVRFRAPAPAVIPSIAVLPFLNLSSDPANEYFADGLSEELTDALCNAGGLHVASRTSAFSFKGKPADVREIGEKLHVAYVVEGSVRKQGGQLKVTAQLIRTDDGYHLWSGSFERQLSDIFAVQQELAGSLVNALQVRLTGAQTRRLRKAHTANQQAFDLYLQGKHFAHAFAPDAIEKASGFFQQSIAADPLYAPAHAALADLYLFENIRADRPASELVAKANTAVLKALALDEELADAHAILGSLKARNEYDWKEAERHLRHALVLNPNSALAHNQLAQNVMAPQGRWQEARAENRLASELDPLSEVIAVSEPWLAYLERRHEAAAEGFRAMLKVFPNDPMGTGGLSSALLGKGDYPAALGTAVEAQRLAPFPLGLAFIGYVHGRMGNMTEARKVLDELHAQGKTRFISPVCFAVVAMGMGDADGAFLHLETARRQQESFLIFARVASIFDPIRSDARYARLLRDVGLSDEQLLRKPGA